MKKEYSDLRAGVILTAFALLLYFYLIPAEIRVKANAATLAADFFPKLLTLVLGVCGLLLVGLKGYELHRHRAQARRERERGEWKTDYTVYLPHALFLVSALVYLGAMQYLGFVLASVLYLLFLLWHFGHAAFLKNLGIAVVYVPVVYYVFSTWFNIRFPMGPFGF